MTNLDIAHRRLHNQFLNRQMFENPVDVVQWLGAMQSQDYAAAKWALGLRLCDASDDMIEQAFNHGAILRTHIMRPTWHFVTPADIRWMLALTAPRVHALNAYYYRKLELDDTVFRFTDSVLVKALQGGNQLTRTELVSVLRRAGITAADLLRFGLIIMHAELEGIICSGARRGKQFTYALLDERAPHSKTLERDEALAELARRYFTGHGPATLEDFVWWSGLAVADAKAGIEMASPLLMQEDIDGQTSWSSRSVPPAKEGPQTVHLLPNYDEYMIGYADRSAVIDESDMPKFDAREGLLGNSIVLDGRVVGTWKRTFKKDAVIVTPRLFAALNEAEAGALIEAANRFGTFLGLPAVLD